LITVTGEEPVISDALTILSFERFI